jgi:hypothetical protein
VRGQVLGDNPTLNNTDVTKFIAGMWKDLSDEDRQIYIQQANEDKERFLLDRGIITED